MPMVGIASSSEMRRATWAGTASSTSREAPGRFERPSVREQCKRLLGGTTLGLEPSEHRRRLRRQPEVAHDRNPCGDDALDPGEHHSCALELDGVGSGLLDEADGIPSRILVGDLERPERHVSDDQRTIRAARDRAGEDQHLLHRRRDRGLVAEHGHRGRVADEHEVRAGLVCESASGRVVGGDHHDRLPPRLHLGELRERQLSGRRGCRCRLLGANAHDVSFQWNIVDEARGADPDRTGQDRRVEVGDLDVVDREAVRLREHAACGFGVAGGERSGEREGTLALVGAEEGVAGGEREAVRVADGREDAEIDVQREVPDQLPDHLHLLGVLLPEVDAPRAHDREQLEDDGCDAAEVPWPELALEDRAELRDLDPGLEALGVHLLEGRREHEVDAGLRGEREIVRLVTGIASEVGLGELGRIHEEAHHDRLALGAGSP